VPFAGQMTSLSIDWDAKLYSLTAYCSGLYVVSSALSLSSPLCASSGSWPRRLIV